MELLTTGITFFQKGGIVMYVLLLCSLFVFSIGIERAMYFRRMDSGRAFARDFYLALANNKWQKAEQLADHARGALADILFAVITKKPEARKNPSAYMEIQSGIALAKMRKRLYYLSVIVTMAPLLGLLGTISGMITSFSVFNLESGQATAITGGVGVGLFSDFSATDRFVSIARDCLPNAANAPKYERMQAAFNEAYDSLCGVYETLKALREA